MRFLLDTHAMLWLLADDRKLGPRARAALSARGSVALVSVVSLWEVALKVAVGKLSGDVREVAAALDTAGLELLTLRRAHVTALATLPPPGPHRDPFDRMLVAQAVAEGLTLMTADRHRAAYGVATIGCA